jgi:outer membrane protein, heavy metal efflux system
VVQAAAREVITDTQPPGPAAGPFDRLTELSADDVTRVVLERNPTLDQMRAAVAAAAARFPQVTSLDDPTVMFLTAPGSAWSPNVHYAVRAEIVQKFLYPGKRGLKGSAALAEAAAAAEELDDVRLELVEAARSALAEYTLAVKAAEVTEENVKLLREIRQNAETRYRTGQGPQQDMLQADVELARQEERRLSLRRARLVAVARLNTLMHLPPDAPLPPPADAGPFGPLPEAASLREAAVARPDLRAVVARVAAEEAALAMALKEYNPDFEVMAAYDGFWQDAMGRPLQWQVGARVNIPLRLAMRGGAVNEARARIAARRAELARLTDQVNLQVQEAYEQARESDEIVRVYETRVLPAAETNVKEALAAYANNQIPFLNLIAAQRELTAIKDRYYEAQAESAQRRAALDRAVGGAAAIWKRQPEPEP